VPTVRASSQLPYKRIINAGMAAATLYFMQAFVGAAASVASLPALYIGTAIAGVLGLLVTAGVGGGDMPVVITCVSSLASPVLHAFPPLPLRRLSRRSCHSRQLRRRVESGDGAACVAERGLIRKSCYRSSIPSGF